MFWDPWTSCPVWFSEKHGYTGQTAPVRSGFGPVRTESLICYRADGILICSIKKERKKERQPGRVTKCCKNDLQISGTEWSHTPADPHSHVYMLSITVQIEICLPPFISWMDDKSINVHISVSKRHLVEKNGLYLPIPLLWFLIGVDYDMTWCWS